MSNRMVRLARRPVGMVKREDFKKFSVATPIKGYDEYEIADAIVIRRQDLFASPALAGYSSAIAIAVALIDKDDPRREQLLTVADYFQRQLREAQLKQAQAQRRLADNTTAVVTLVHNATRAARYGESTNGQAAVRK